MEAERDKVNPFEVIIWMNDVNVFIQTLFWFYLFLLILIKKAWKQQHVYYYKYNILINIRKD